jgi:hypothetical protein
MEIMKFLIALYCAAFPIWLLVAVSYPSSDISVGRGTHNVLFVAAAIGIFSCLWIINIL